MAVRRIDVWDVRTFDTEIVSALEANNGSVGNSENDALCNLLQSRSVRVWHYTRLCEHELRFIRNEGLKVSSREFLRARLDRMVDAGYLSADESDELFGSSCYFDTSGGNRTGKIWVSLFPIDNCSNDEDILEFLGKWGGESVTLDQKQMQRLNEGSRPYVLALSLQISFTDRVSWVAKALKYTFARSRNSDCEFFRPDVYSCRDLLPDNIITILDASTVQYNDAFIEFQKC